MDSGPQSSQQSLLRWLWVSASQPRRGLGLSVWWNPQGLFIALEDVGYLMMGVAFLFIALTFGRRERLERIIRLILGTSSVLAVGSLILLALLYGSDLEYRYGFWLQWSPLPKAGSPRGKRSVERKN